MTYEAFLVALFAIAAGCSILETSANPYVMSLGPEETATRRLNFAQAFNPVGTNIGVFLAATLILPKLDEPMNMANLDPGPGAGDPGRPTRRGDGPLPRARIRLDRHRSGDRDQEVATDRRGVRVGRPRRPEPDQDPVVQQALHVRRRSAVLQRGRPGLHLDLPHPVLAAGAERIAAVGWLPATGQPDRVPDLPLHHDLGDRQGPPDEGARSSWRTCRPALHLRHVLAERGRRYRRRRVVLLPVVDVPDDLRCRAHRDWGPRRNSARPGW